MDQYILLMILHRSIRATYASRATKTVGRQASSIPSAKLDFHSVKQDEQESSGHQCLKKKLYRIGFNIGTWMMLAEIVERGKYFDNGK